MVVDFKSACCNCYSTVRMPFGGIAESVRNFRTGRTWRVVWRFGFPSITIGGVAYGCWQGYTLRNKFRKSTHLDPPQGPQDGVERWVDRAVALKEEIVAKMQSDDSFIAMGIKRIKDLIEKNRTSAEQKKETIRDAIFQRRKLREVLRNRRKKRGVVASGTAVPVTEAVKEGEPIVEAVLQAAVQDVCLQANALAKKYDAAMNKVQRESKKDNSRRQVKLLVLGDSLVSGVGIEGVNTQAMSPILPKLVAEVLSCTLKADVEWYCAGYVGADAQMLRESVIPEVKERMYRGDACVPINTSHSKNHMIKESTASVVKRYHPRKKRYFFPFFTGGDIDMNPYQQEDDILQHPSKEDSLSGSESYKEDHIHHNNKENSLSGVESHKDNYSSKDSGSSLSSPSLQAQNKDAELIVIIICGLNDWKHMLEYFPKYGLGPSGFRKELHNLINDVKSIGEELKCKSCHVFLPKMPITCIEDDPNFILGVRPLWYLVEWLFYLWDLQKYAVAAEDEKASITVINSPDPLSDYATPGEGNISSDGVHPSIQGYKWWALHISEEVFRTYIANEKTHDLDTP